MHDPSQNGFAANPRSALSSPENFAAGVNVVMTDDQLATFNAGVRSMTLQIFDQYFDKRRDLDKECGFPSRMDCWQYWKLYNEDAIAARVVECVPKSAWQVQPSVYEDEDEETDTDFEAAWDALSKSLRGERSYYQSERGSPVFEALAQADVMCGVGQYGVILLGIGDGLDLSMPANGVVETGSIPKKVTKGKRTAQEQIANVATGKVPKGVPVYNIEWNFAPARYQGPPPNTYTPDIPYSEQDESGIETKFGFGDGEEEEVLDLAFVPRNRLLFLRTFPEPLAQIVRFETNPTSPRYCQPTMYQLAFNDRTYDNGTQGAAAPQITKLVHWTRVVHVLPEGPRTSEVYGQERMRQVYRLILGAQKLYYGAPEMYWKGAFPGLKFTTHPQLGGQVNVDQKSFKQAMQDYQNSLQRVLVGAGGEFGMLSPTVVDCTPQVAMVLEAICIRLNIPMRKFKGSERGELASSQDDGDWNDVIKTVQYGHTTPRVIVPFVDRLINLGVLPVPEGGYSVEWPDVSTQSRKEKADVALVMVQAIVAYIAGNGATMLPPIDLWTRVFDISTEEAEEIVARAQKIADQMKQDELAQQQQQASMQMDQQEEAIDRGIAPDPTAQQAKPAPFQGGAQ